MPRFENIARTSWLAVCLAAIGSIAPQARALAEDWPAVEFACAPGAERVVQIPFDADSVSVYSTSCICDRQEDKVKKWAHDYVLAVVKNETEIARNLIGSYTIDLRAGTTELYCYYISDLDKLAAKTLKDTR